MEKFQNLDWHPALEDLIDNVFIRDERMERESAMYRILTDSFTNPIENIEDEYADVDIKLIKKYLDEDGVFTDTDEEDSCMRKQEQTYVPGIRKLSFPFPRRSHLDKAQQAMCLRVLIRLSNNVNRDMSDKERRELDQYMTLRKTIAEEQKEFLDFAKSKWNDAFRWNMKCNEYVTSKWNAKMQRFKKLPRYYVESINIPLSVQENNLKNEDIKMTATPSCLRQGFFSKVILPKLDRPHMLFMDPSSLQARYPPCIAPDKVTQHFRLPVSEDIYCERFAVEAKADFVISSSGLKCLLSNINPDHSDSWLVPVVVRSCGGKNIIYVDKRLPPASATVSQKNTWIYKYVLRHYFVDVPKNESSEKTKQTKEEDKLETTANHSDSDSNLSIHDHLKIYEEDLYLSDTDKSDDLASGETDSKVNEQQNVSYNLFQIGQIDLPKHERIKHGIKVYRILVRTKTDGIEKKSQPLILVPKMEHQLEFGAEAITLEEGLHQWASLIFRPKTSLARVRIAADTSEIIQIERHTTMSLSNELKRLYNIKVEDSLNILYNIIEKLSSLTPGRYIMQHVPQNGAFAYVYVVCEHTTEDRKNAFDLHTVCPSKFQTISKTPWPRIDNMISTPALRCFNRMPAMFYPILGKKFISGRPRGRPKKNTSGINNQVPVSPRRSVRLRKTNTTNKGENAV